MGRKLMSMPHVAMMDTEQRMALYAFFEHITRRDDPNSPGSVLKIRFDAEERQVFEWLYTKSYHYGKNAFNNPSLAPSREARDRFCHRFLPNLCGYEPTEEDPTPTPPPALSRLDIEERLQNCEFPSECYLEGCQRRHAPGGWKPNREGRPASLEISESDFQTPLKHRLRNLVQTVMGRRQD